MYGSSAMLIALLLAGQAPAGPPANSGMPVPTDPLVSLPMPSLPVDASTAGAAEAAPVEGGFTLATPIRVLIADPRARAVLDRDLPGLSEDANLAKFEMLSLRAFQPQTGGQLSLALLAKTGKDLAAIGAASGVAAAPLVVEPPKALVGGRNRDAGR